MTRRLKLTVEYDGTRFGGWQRQKHVTALPAVQDCLEEAIFRMTGEQVTLAAAGRTDAGVHAVGQVCHFDIESMLPLIRFKDGLIRLTPHGVSISRAEVVEDTFHARFSATSRRYVFLIYNRREYAPLWENRAVLVRDALDVDVMHRAAQCLLGENDFSAFRSSECSAKTPFCNMHFVKMERLTDVDPHLVAIHLQSNRFLHNMVRILAGTLCAVGSGKLPPSAVEDMLRSGVREKGGVTLAPHGLCFMEAVYGDYKVLEVC